MVTNLILLQITEQHDMHDIHELFGEISDKALDVVRGLLVTINYMQKNVGVLYMKRVMVQNPTYTAFYGVGHIM